MEPGSLMNNAQYHYKQNRFQQLRGFCYSAASGSISAAARRMSLSQPSVSQQILTLEAEMGVKLFDRRKGRITLTAEGERLYEMAMPLVEQIEDIDTRFALGRENFEEGNIDLAAGGSTLLHVLPEPLDKFRQAHPGIGLRLHNVTGPAGLVLVRGGYVDFAVGPLLDVPEDLEFYPIVSYHHVLITCLRHPLVGKRKLTLKDISRYALVLPPRNLSTWTLIDSTFREHRLSYEVALEVGGWDVIKKYVEMGLGISIVMSVCITGDEKLEVFPLDRFFPRKTYGIVMRKGKVLSAQAMRLARLLFTGSEEITTRTPASFMSGNHKR
jgi:DNA-binding transcriptional LysR family regulator